MDVQRRKKIFAIEQFGGKCQMCGYDKCINALCFHHLDKTEKEFKPSYIIMRWSWEKVKLELDKCILVCSNCHAEIHFLDKNVDVKHLVRPWIDVECKCCKKSFSTKNPETIFCSNSCKTYDTRKVNRPTKEELEILIKTESFRQIGKMFGVSDNAVRKWAKSYNLMGH